MDPRYIPEDLSIVIATYNRPEGVNQILKIIPKEIEVIVADDGTLPKLKLAEGIKFFTHEHDGNRVSTVRNEGAKLATRPKILFLDDDVVPYPLSFFAHSLALEMYDLSLGLLPKVKWQPYTDDRLMFYMREDQILWQWCWTGNLAVKSDIFRQLGGFDELTFNGGRGFEDVDFGRRAFLANKKLVLNRLAFAWHPSSHTSENPHPDVLRNQEKYNEKWGIA
jgi:GT2 family glycosyltransferase